MEINRQNFASWGRWTLGNTAAITLSYMVSLIAVLIVHSAFGFSMQEWGTPFSQTLMQVAGGIVIGLGTGLYQKSFFQARFNIHISWVRWLIIGFAATEIIAGVILWLVGLNRGELRFIESNPLPEALIFGIIGLFTGLLQWPVLSKNFAKSGYWVLASSLGWSLCILINLLDRLPFVRYSIAAFILVFVLGAMLYGAITGGTLIWIMKQKPGNSVNPS